MPSPIDVQSCPCGAGKAFGNCCGRLHREGSAGLGTTAEETMRARYSAYVFLDGTFLLASWHPTTRPASVDFSEDIEWHGLEIVDTREGGALDAAGTVEFRARFRRGDAHLELHELSSFRREAGRWYYVAPVT